MSPYMRIRVYFIISLFFLRKNQICLHEILQKRKLQYYLKSTLNGISIHYGISH